MSQGVAQSLHGVLAGAIGALRRRGHQTGDRTDHDDAAGAPLPHFPQRRPGHAYDTEEIGLELPPPIFHVHVFDGCEIGQSRVVDEHINLACFLVHHGNRPLDGAVIRDIHFQGFQWQSLFLRQGIQLRALLRLENIGSLGGDAHFGLDQVGRDRLAGGLPAPERGPVALQPGDPLGPGGRLFPRRR